MELTPVQVRILGSLVEKELATPDNYPLTMNALLSACNQTSNRNPVVRYDEATVGNALENLRAARLARVVYSRSNRADKYRHVLDEALGLEQPELAVLAGLMLRGAQTAAELRSRTERLHAFATQDDLDHVLQRLAERDEPLVVRLERRPGQKEPRWVHLLAGEALAREAAAAADDEPGDVAGRQRADRLAALEAAVEALREEVDRLRGEQEALVTRLGPLLD